MKKAIDFIKSSIPKSNFEFERKEFEIREPTENVIAIDGGSAIIADGGSWLIGYIRVGKVEYNKFKEVSEEIEEYWVGIANQQIKVFKDEEEINVPINYHERDMEKLVGEIRKFLEFKKAAEQDSLTLIDNQIKVVEGWEEDVISEFKRVVGIPKTTRASINGRSVIGLLSKYPGRWYTRINDQIFAKLHENSKYVYKIDLKNVDESVLGIIAYFSSDPELLGYPYPLLKVDKVARISKFEKKALREKAKELLGELSSDLLSQDMHQKLDERAYR